MQHRPAGRVHEHATDAAQLFEVLQLDTERRDDHHVVLFHGREVERPVVVREQEVDPALAKLLVHVRVVDDLADQEDLPVGELGSGLVGVVDGPVDAVAEAEAAGHAERESSEGQPIIGRLDRLHDLAAVGTGQERLHLGLETEPASEVVVAVRFHRALS